MATDRLVFLKWAREKRIESSCLRMHRIFNYKPGHVRYQFGHYPTHRPYSPTERDWSLLDTYADKGMGVVHVWQWSDICGYLGKGIYEPLNKNGLRRFIEECHRRSLKVVPYVSPGFFDVRHPLYNASWSSGTPHLKEVYYDLDKLCPGSRSWRVYFFSVVEQLLDGYGFDGLYWDTGFGIGCSNPHPDDHVHFIEFAPFAAGAGSWDHVSEARFMEKAVNEGCWDLWNEFLCEIYARVKERDGLVVAHIGADTTSPFKDKSWDYLLLGEGVSGVEDSMEKCKVYDPYVIRFTDWSRLITNWREKDLTPHLELVPGMVNQTMAAAVPYLQFPWLEDGCYGADEDIFSLPGVLWKQEWDLWTEWMKAQKKAGLPPLMGASFAAGREQYFEYLNVYKDMTRGNTLVYMEVAVKNGSFPVTEEKRRVSVFLNDNLWVAIGNLEVRPMPVRIGPLTGGQQGEPLLLAPNALTVLRYDDLTSLPEVITFGRDERTVFTGKQSNL